MLIEVKFILMKIECTLNSEEWHVRRVECDTAIWNDVLGSEFLKRENTCDEFGEKAEYTRIWPCFC